MQQVTTVPSVGQRYIKFIQVTEISPHQLDYKDSKRICLTFRNRASYIQGGHTATLQTHHFIYFFKKLCTEYFKHAAHSPFFFSSKCRLFHNATFFGSRIIHILLTGCAKI